MFAACALAVAYQGSPSCDSIPDPLRLPSLSASKTGGSFDLDSQSGPRATSPIDRWEPFIAEASQRFAIPQEWIRAVMRAESGGRTTLDGRPITSAAGAMGLMQLMPGTFADMRRRYGLGLDSYDPRDNILAGAAYLREMYRQYGYPSLFAAYHAGPRRFDGYLLQGQALPRATLAYVGGIVPGVETTMTPRRLGPANPSSQGGFAHLDRRSGAANRMLFFVLNNSEVGQSSSTADTNPSAKSSRPSSANSGLSDTSTPPNNATPMGSLFVPLSRLHP